MGKLNFILAEATMLMMVMMSSAASDANFTIARPGCADRCGNISIPFPFGIGEGCSLNQDFLIDCILSDLSGSTPTPFLKGKNNPIISISIKESQLKVLHPVIAVGCYNYTTKSLETTSTFSSFDPFRVSTSNSVFVTGCQNYGLFNGIIGRDLNSVFACISVCAEGFVRQNTSCSGGQGCCQTTLPSQLRTLSTLALESLPNGTQFLPDLGNCSYSFIASNSSLYDRTIQENSVTISSTFPMDLSWFVTSNKICGIDVGSSSDYACKNNTDCLNVLYSTKSVYQYEGYQCNCSRGYEGNPFLGCTDIDECVSPNDNDCAHVCVNRPGGYFCECLTGYHGDGRKNGTGCLPIRYAQKSMSLLAVVGGTSLGICLLLATTFLLYKTIKKQRNQNRRQKFFKKNGGQLLDQLASNGNNIEKVHIFTARELNKATDHFNENRVLGRGGQGTVYKGMLSDGTIIAVKKSKLVDAIQVEQFINEVVILSYIDHRNVVKLLGCCLETEVPLLVYEHIPNGTLNDLIHNNEGDDFTLSWEVRIRISKEVSRALAYLHSATSIPVYHRDVKSSNILLDEKYKVKVSDFGISRHISIEQTHLTTLVKGTMGYLDPEYFQTGQFTEKSDVYSFGVILVELLTGRKPLSLHWVEEEEAHISSTAMFLQSMEDNSLQTILDYRVLQTARKEDVEVVAKLAKRCLNLEGRTRPTMTQVAMALEGILQTPPLPSIVESNFNDEKFGTSKIFRFWSGSNVDTTSSSVDEFPLLSDL